MKLDKYEEEVLAAFESGAPLPIATKEELERIRESARATAIKDQRINIRLSAGDLRDIQVKAMQEGMPYQTLIASVLHKYVTGRLAEKSHITQSGPNGDA
jgi:predicted DNA binding CopG/RHH family protein